MTSSAPGSQGFAYEQRIHNRLNAARLVPAGFTPAGSDPNAADCMFNYDGDPWKLEVKLDLRADYGQGTLNYVDGSWVLGGARTAAADEMRRLLRTVGIEAFANREWGRHGAPNKEVVMKESYTQEHVREDYQKFTDRFLTINYSALNSYYASKDTYYIQIGQLGMYYMASNPAGLPVPQFTPNMRIRIRTKRGGSNPIYNYRFTTALQITQRPAASTYNIDRSIDFLTE